MIFTSPREVQEAVEHSPLNTAEPVEVIRDGKPVTLSVTVETMPENYGMEEHEPAEHTKKAPESSSYSADGIGLSVGDMTTDETNDTYKGFEGALSFAKSSLKASPQKKACVLAC